MNDPSLTDLTEQTAIEAIIYRILNELSPEASTKLLHQIGQTKNADEIRKLLESALPANNDERI